MFQINVNNKVQLMTDEGNVFFDRPIAMAIELQGTIVVCLETTEDAVDYLNNVYGVRNSQVIWRVQDMLEYNPKFNTSVRSFCYPYNGIRVYEKDNGLILGNTGYGFRFLIDPANGKIVGEESWMR